MLPNFLIIGAQKGATSWLARCLDQHPDAFVPEWEVHFFNHRFSKGLEWYESQFHEWSGEPVVGEKSPGYLNYVETPGRIRETLGDKVKLIASLRHPIDRAYSAFWQFVKRQQVPADADFRTVFLQEDQFGMRDRGLYYTHLTRYLEHFARENMLILIYEELRYDNEKAITECFDFLGLDRAKIDGSPAVPKTVGAQVNQGRDLKRFHGTAVALRRSIAGTMMRLPRKVREPLLGTGRKAFEQVLRRLPEERSYKRLDPGVRQELLQEFMPEIKQLEELLDRDLSIWYKTKPSQASAKPAVSGTSAAAAEV